MEMNTTYAGMDVHAAKIQVAVLVPGTKHRTELELENEPPGPETAGAEAEEDSRPMGCWPATRRGPAGSPSSAPCRPRVSSAT